VVLDLVRSLIRIHRSNCHGSPVAANYLAHVDSDYLSDLKPLQLRAETHRLYSEKVDDYDGAVLQAAAVQDDERVLDVGAGTGEFLHQLSQEVALTRACGLDTSEPGIKNMKALGLEAFLGNACRLPFDAETFDVVFAKHMLYHVANVDLAVSEAARVLSENGGRLIAAVNLKRSQSKLSEVLTRSAEKHGVEAPETLTDRANEENLLPIVSRHFESSHVALFHNALVFHELDPLIAYASASLGFFGVPVEHPQRSEVLHTVRQVLADEFGRSQQWRDAKGYVLIVRSK